MAIHRRSKHTKPLRHSGVFCSRGRKYSHAHLYEEHAAFFASLCVGREVLMLFGAMTRPHHSMASTQGRASSEAPKAQTSNVLGKPAGLHQLTKCGNRMAFGDVWRRLQGKIAQHIGGDLEIRLVAV
jgi:hypothetical protein